MLNITERKGPKCALRPTAVEEYDRDNEFHLLLQRLNNNHGAGEIVAICHKQTGNLVQGIVTCNLQHGFTTKRFSVETYFGKFKLRFLGKEKIVPSDYFD